MAALNAYGHRLRQKPRPRKVAVMSYVDTSGGENKQPMASYYRHSAMGERSERQHNEHLSVNASRQEPVTFLVSGSSAGSARHLKPLNDRLPSKSAAKVNLARRETARKPRRQYGLGEIHHGVRPQWLSSCYSKQPSRSVRLLSSARNQSRLYFATRSLW